jgi:hypothetical protein
MRWSYHNELVRGMTRHKITLPKPGIESANGKFAWFCPYCEVRSNFGHTRVSALKGGRNHLWTFHRDFDRLHPGSL